MTAEIQSQEPYLSKAASHTKIGRLEVKNLLQTKVEHFS